MSMDMRDFLKKFNIALISMLIGSGLWIEAGYADTLRLQLGKIDTLNRIKETEVRHLVEKAEQIEKELLSDLSRSEKVSEEEIWRILLALAPYYLSPHGYDVFKKVNGFYLALNNKSIRDKLLENSNEIAEQYLAKIPSICAILPAGQFYVDMYDPVARRFLSFMQLVRGEIDEFTYLRTDLPDYDFIHIFELPEGIQWVLHRNADEELRLIFMKMVSNMPEWKLMIENLSRDFNLYPVKFTSAAEERKTTIEDFMKNGTIALCLGNPIPATLWNNLSVFICRDDCQFLNCIRDLMIGLDKPIYAEQYIDSNVPNAFRLNCLLNQIKEKGPQDVESILKYIFDEVAKTMPKRPRHSASSGLVNFSRRHWKETFRVAEESGFVRENKNHLFELTKEGEERLDRILAQREEILSYGLPKLTQPTLFLDAQNIKVEILTISAMFPGITIFEVKVNGEEYEISSIGVKRIKQNLISEVIDDSKRCIEIARTVNKTEPRLGETALKEKWNWWTPPLDKFKQAIPSRDLKLGL